MKIKNRTIIAIAILIIVGIVYYYQEIRVVEQVIPKVGVVVATKDIPYNTVLDESMVAIEERFTEDQLKEKGYITSTVDKVLGKRTRVPLYKNETIKLQRLMDNEKYMDYYKDIKRTIFEFTIRKEDKALNLKAGSYIDIWLEPNDKGLETLKTSRKIFEKKQVLSIKDDNFLKLGSTPDSYIPSYIAIQLTDEEIKELLDVVDTEYYEYKVTLYGENLEESIKVEILEEQKRKAQEQSTENNENDSMESDNNE